MLAFLKQWLMGVTAAALLVAVAESMMPKGPVRRLGRLTGGLVMLLAVLSPILKLDGDALSRALVEYQFPMEDTQTMATANAALLKELIVERSDAYISDKAEGLGIQCVVTVETREGEDGYPIPCAVKIEGDLTQEQRSSLTRRIEADFAIPAECQTYCTEETK